MCDCIKKVNISEIKCEEKQSKFILLNSQHKFVDKIKIDGCIYKRGHPELRCDYALNYNNTTVFVELKGSKIAHAIDQILATKKAAKFPINLNLVAVIVASKMPQNDSSTQARKMKLKEHKINLVQPRNSPLKIQFDDLFPA